MNYSRFDKRKKNNSKLKWVIAIVVVFLVAVGGTIYYLNDKGTTKEQTTEPPKITDTKNSTTDDTASVKSENPDQSERVEGMKESPTVDAAGYAVLKTEVTEPTYIDGVLIANKKYPLPKDFQPGEDPEALAAYKEMEKAAKKEGFTIKAFSSFRSYEYQQQLYDKYVARDGKEKADRYSARPGHSEHQTGLAFDIGEVGHEDLWLTEEFGETPAGQWLVKKANEYGFILRYPKGKEDITGFMYESWHFRYVGKELAKKVYDSGLTLEEYLGIE